jgi:uncharacterized membrane protein YoaK (UPF0700 family)
VSPRWRSSTLLLSLALAAGSVDALSYLGLGRVFTANMTGNTVLLGVAVARGSGGDAVRSAVALGGFCVGVAAGVALSRTRRPWPQLATFALLLEAIALAAALTIWAAAGVSADTRRPLIAVCAAAMGSQSAAVRSSDVRGVNTTFMTGTLTNAIARAVLSVKGVSESRDGPTLPGAAWIIYGLGALVGALMEHAWGAAALALPLALVGVVTAAAR